jgi:hypothetical protein
MFQALSRRYVSVACGLLACWVALPLHAQDRIYRCGNEYTNNPTPAQRKECKALEGGNVTVVQGPARAASRPQGSTAATPAPASSDQPRVDPGQQKARDSDARAILESELRRAEVRLADAQREYNGGNPERRGDEARNHGKYAERVAELKSAVTRAEADVAGLRRELARVGAGAATAGAPAPVKP